jgi:chromosome segregation ATPase
MDFHTFAAGETSALIERLVGRQSDASLQQLRLLREALDAAAHAIAQPVTADADIQELTERLAGTAEAETQRIRHEASLAVRTAEEEIAARTAEIERLQAVLQQADRDAAALRTEIDSLRDRAETADRDLEATMDAHTTLETALREIEAAARDTARDKSIVEQELADTRAALDRLATEMAALQVLAEQRDAERVAALNDLERAREAAADRDGLAADRETLAGIRDALAADLEAARGRVAFLDRELALAAEIKNERDGLMADVAALQRVAEQHETEKAAALASLQQARDAGADRDGLAAALEAARARIESLDTELALAAEIKNERDALMADVAALQRVAEQRETEKTAALAALEEARDAGAERDGIAAALEAARARVESLEGEIGLAEEIGREREALIAGLETRAGRIQALEQEVAGVADMRSERDALTARLEVSIARIQELETKLAAAGDIEEPTGAAVSSELAASLERIQALERMQAARDEDVRELRARLHDAAAVESTLRREAAQAAAARANASAEDPEVLRNEIERLTSLFDASARAVAEMTAVQSSTELLAELTRRMSLQFSRVALFRVKGTRLEAEHHVGFDDTTDMTKLVMPVSADSILGRAVASGLPEVLSGDDVAVQSGTPFGGTPTSAVALPIVLQGTTLAVVYADDSDMPETARGAGVHESSVGYARLLAGQAVVLLIRHTHELKTLAELSQYATTLLQEAKEMYLADTQAGKNPELLRKRLRDNIDCASQLYAYRAAMEGTAAAGLLDEQIAVELEGDTAFARDLAAVIGAMSAADIQLTAEAS